MILMRAFHDWLLLPASQGPDCTIQLDDSIVLACGKVLRSDSRCHLTTYVSLEYT